MRKSTCRPAFGTRPRPANCFWSRGLLVGPDELRAMPASQARGGMSIARLTRLSGQGTGGGLLRAAGARLLSAAHARHPCCTPVRRLLLSPQSCFARMPSPDSPSLLTSGLVRTCAGLPTEELCAKISGTPKCATPLSRCAARPRVRACSGHVRRPRHSAVIAMLLPACLRDVL